MSLAEDFFKPEDFYRVSTCAYPKEELEYLAKLANAKLANSLGPEIYGEFRDVNGPLWRFSSDPTVCFGDFYQRKPTHTARLFNLQAIKNECKHDGNFGFFTKDSETYKECLQCRQKFIARDWIKCV